MSGYNHYAHFGGSHSQHVDVFGAYQELIETSGIPAMSHAPMPSSTPDPPRSLQPNGNYNFSYPSIASTIPTNPGQSPFKASGPTAPLAPLKKAPNGVMMNSPHIIPPNIQPHGSDFMPQKQPTLGHQYGPAPLRVGSGKDSVTTGVPFLHSSTPNMMIEQYYPYPSSLNGKRLLEAPSIQDSRPQKRIKLENQPLPPPESFPPILDDGIKPSHSYAMLIGMAILRSPHRRLTLAQIYKWITTNYRHYREAADNGWQNSIRHNLSLNKNFIKHERPKDDPGKGSYWAIMPGMEHVYMKEKPGRKSISTPEGMTIIGAVMENSILPQTSNPEPKLPPQTCSELSSEDATAATASQPCSAQQPELSSDATIPPQEEPLAKITEAESSTDLNSFSPNAEDMRSSPPLPKHAEIHGETPPSMMRRNSTTLKSHRRQRASMDDSGYISSLDSSILRPQQQTLLASETDRLDRSRNKRKGGRAEDEIRRLRGSSFDPSPTKCRSRNTTFGSQSSSPTRRFAGEGQMLPPLTPAYKLAPPPSIAPLSVSPNTTLQQHRRDVARMIESPLKRVMGLAGDCGWATPSNDHIDESVYNDSYNFNSGYGGDFYILQDATPGGLYSIAEDGSPVKRKRSIIDSSPLKRPTKRQGLPRPKSTAILGDVTHSNQQLSLAPAPLLKSKLSPAKYLALKSPGKKLPDLPSSPSKIFAGSPLKMGPSLGTLDTVNDENAVPSVLFQDFCSTELLEDGSESTDVDIMKGFERIGQNVGADPGNMPFAVANFKPGLGRNHTSTY